MARQWTLWRGRRTGNLVFAAPCGDDAYDWLQVHDSACGRTAIEKLDQVADRVCELSETDSSSLERSFNLRKEEQHGKEDGSAEGT